MHPSKSDSASPPPVNLQLLGVEYQHSRTSDSGDLYVTRYGLHRREHLQPENWYEKPWFDEKRERLNGTSTIYRVPTRPVDGQSIELVVKWSRVGQDVPLSTRVMEDVLNAEFNSPFEEFALVEELRAGRHGPPGLHIRTHRPLAIYVPPERLQAWQTGRSRLKINLKILNHPGVELDLLRQYIMVYEWIRGVDAAEAFEQLRLPPDELSALTHEVTADLRSKGFRVADMKPAHIIVRKRNSGRLSSRRGRVLRALVDFELLQRTPEYEKEITDAKRREYLIRERDRFDRGSKEPIPSHLQSVRIFGVDYIYGRVESTGGALWIVGHDAGLFDFFQPERWRKTVQVRLSLSHQAFSTISKDNIHLVWKTSRVGEIPIIPAEGCSQEEMLAWGYNSPFEEFSIADDLLRHSALAIYPRAIYMTGSRSSTDGLTGDGRRYDTHRNLLTPEGEPILRPEHDYIKIWGFWHGPIERLTESSRHRFETFNLPEAFGRGLLREEEVELLVEWTRARLAAAGYRALGFSSHHLIVTVDESGGLLRAANGGIDSRLCNYEFIQPLGARHPADFDAVARGARATAASLTQDNHIFLS